MSLSLGTIQEWARFDVWTYLDEFGGLDLIGRFEWMDSYGLKI